MGNHPHDGSGSGRSRRRGRTSKIPGGARNLTNHRPVHRIARKSRLTHDGDRDKTSQVAMNRPIGLESMGTDILINEAAAVAAQDLRSVIEPPHSAVACLTQSSGVG